MSKTKEQYSTEIDINVYQIALKNISDTLAQKLVELDAANEKIVGLEKQVADLKANDSGPDVT